MTASVRGQNLTYTVADSLGTAIVTGVHTAGNPMPIEAEHGDGDPLEPDIAFHVAVLHASRNRFYAQLAGFTATALRISIRMTNRYKSVRLASVADHKKVADAIIAGRPAAAGEAMRKLIQEALDQVARRVPVNANR